MTIFALNAVSFVSVTFSIHFYGVLSLKFGLLGNYQMKQAFSYYKNREAERIEALALCQT